MNNRQLADQFTLIANLLEIKGENPFKIRAYRRASESLLSLSKPAADMISDGTLEEVPGIGKAIHEKIEELLSTGKLDYIEKLAQEVPLSLVDLLSVPDMGPKKVTLVWQQVGVSTLDQLEAAARDGKLRYLPGMGEKSEAKILAGLEALKRRTGRTPLGIAWPFAEELMEFLRKQPSVIAAEAAGSLRRMKPTVGDLDLLVSASDSNPVMDAFTKHPLVVRVVGKGTTKSSVEFDNGLRAQLWVHPPERFGTALQYATGSKEHNVRLREIAQSLGFSLSEHAITLLDGSEILCETEGKVYETLDLPWIWPELREDRGEIQAARLGKLPAMLDEEHWIAELHSHSTWSDGAVGMREMVLEAQKRGYHVLAITDHSHSLGIVQGIKPEDVRKQKEEIDRLRDEFGQTFQILHGVEVEIRADGSLDYPDEILASLDFVIASLHVSLRQPREQVTSRVINAIKNPHVDLIGHPTGRLIPDREGADLDMEAVLAAAAKNGVAMEINANPSRLDLEDIYARRVIELGIPISINTDAHRPEDMDLIHYGIATARRGWVEPKNVINTWEPGQLLSWLRKRGERDAH